MPTQAGKATPRSSKDPTPKRPPQPPATTTPGQPAATSGEEDDFQAVKERLADKIGGLASAALQIPASVHVRTAAQAQAQAAAPLATQRDRGLARLGAAVHRALPAALQDLDRELDAALGRAEAVQRCLSVLEGAQARHEQQQRQRQRRQDGRRTGPPA